MAGLAIDDPFVDETQPLLLHSEESDAKKVTPLPKLQMSILLLFLLAEPMTSNCIYPFINQVCLPATKVCRPLKVL